MSYDLQRGDRVKATRELYRGKVPVGTEGTFLEYRPFRDYFSAAPDAFTTMAVVDFPVLGPRHVSPKAIRRVASLPDGFTYVPHAIPRQDTGKARALANAHNDVAKAYGELALALDHLKEVEAR